MHTEDCKCSVQLQNISVHSNGEWILRDINLEARHGEIMALVGRNGAGKTTLLKTLLGRVPYSGQIRFFNAHGMEISRPVIGYVPQRTTYDTTMPMTVADLLCAHLTQAPVWLMKRKHAIQEAEELLKQTGCAHLLDRKIGNLSGGELQRVLLACALSPMPDLLLLDEAVSAVDRKGIESFYEVVTSLRKTYQMPIFLVSHNFSHVRKYANRAALLDQTILKQGPVEMVLTSDEAKRAFGLI